MGIAADSGRHIACREFLPDKVQTFINPLTGRKSRRRVRQSTEDLGIRGMADYIDKCCAWAAEHGITISAPLPELWRFALQQHLCSFFDGRD